MLEYGKYGKNSNYVIQEQRFKETEEQEGGKLILDCDMLPKGRETKFGEEDRFKENHRYDNEQLLLLDADDRKICK